MSIKPLSRFSIRTIAMPLSLLSIAMLVSCSAAGITDSSDDMPSGQDVLSTAIGQVGESSGEDSASGEDSSGDDSTLNTCPKGPIFMKVEMIEAWTFSPGGIEELGRIDGWGKVTCMVEVSGSKVPGEVGCYFEYSNEGFLQGDPARCDISGQGVAKATITGSCDNFTLKLQIDETVEPDEKTGDVPMTATMKCDNKTYPHITYFPFTWFEVEVPLAAGEFETSLGKGDCPVGFVECDKLYYFSVHDPEFQE